MNALAYDWALKVSTARFRLLSLFHVLTDIPLQPAWWHKSVDGGPIVENGTHICDLSRFFGGEVDLSSMLAHSIEWYQKPGKLSKVRENVDIVVVIHILISIRQT